LTREGESRLESHRQRKWRVRQIRRRVPRRAEERIRAQPSVGVGLTASIVNPVAFSYGYDRLRFIRPVFIGDTITMTYTIERMVERELKTYATVVGVNQHGVTCFAAVHIGQGLPPPKRAKSAGVKRRTSDGTTAQSKAGRV